MNGKLKLKLGNRTSFNNNRYELFLDEAFIGSLDYKNPKLHFLISFSPNK